MSGPTSISAPLQRLVAQWAADDRRAAAARSAEKPDPLLDALERAAPIFDSGWHPQLGRRLRPSALKILRYCVLMSSAEASARDHAQSLARTWLRGIGQAVTA